MFSCEGMRKISGLRRLKLSKKVCRKGEWKNCIVFRHHRPVVLVSANLNPHKHNIWTPYVHLFTFLQRFSRFIRPSSGRKRKYVNVKVCCGSLFYSTLFHLCSCVFCLMMLEWNNRKIFRKVNKWTSLFKYYVCVDLNCYWNYMLSEDLTGRLLPCRCWAWVGG
jgi:hypothetical protein